MKTYCKSYRSPYVANVTALFDAVLQSQLSHTAIHLYLMLVATMNRQCWPDTIEMSDRVMAGQVGMTTATTSSRRASSSATQPEPAATPTASISCGSAMPECRTP